MDTPSRPNRRRLVIALASVLALVALGYGAIIFYAEVINDAPEALDSGDLEAALAATTTEAPGDAPAAADEEPEAPVTRIRSALVKLERPAVFYSP